MNTTNSTSQASRVSSKARWARTAAVVALAGLGMTAPLASAAPLGAASPVFVLKDPIKVNPNALPLQFNGPDDVITIKANEPHLLSEYFSISWTTLSGGAVIFSAGGVHIFPGDTNSLSFAKDSASADVLSSSIKTSGPGEIGIRVYTDDGGFYTRSNAVLVAPTATATTTATTTTTTTTTTTAPPVATTKLPVATTAQPVVATTTPLVIVTPVPPVVATAAVVTTTPVVATSPVVTSPVASTVPPVATTAPPVASAAPAAAPTPAAPNPAANRALLALALPMSVVAAHGAPTAPAGVMLTAIGSTKGAKMTKAKVGRKVKLVCRGKAARRVCR